MTQVRQSEKDMREGNHKVKFEVSKENIQSQIEEIEPIEEAIVTEESLMKEELTIADDVNSEPEEDMNEQDAILELIEDCQKVETEPIQKKQKIANSQATGIPEMISFTHYELEQFIEKDQNIITLNVSSMSIDRPAQGNYEFDVDWLRHADQKYIYKCKYCIKAFANAEFLLKHMTASHICLVCLEILDNYKELNQHGKEKHKNIICPHCSRSWSSPASYRQHLKKQHYLQLPSHIGILTDYF